MIRYHFDLYPRSNPQAGTKVVRFTKLQSAEYRGEANGTGSGRLSIRADTTEAQFIDPRGLQYVRVVREDTVAATELVVGGFFLDSGDFTALDERGTRLLTFGGAGTLSYLARAVMASHTYISPIFTGQDPFDDTWRLYAQSTVYANGNFLGAMLWRVIYEAQHFTPGSHKHVDGVVYTDTHADDRPANALPALTMGFTAFNDSNGAAWAVSSGEFKAQVGENVLAVVKRLMEAGLYVSMDPDTFELDAYPAATHRRTRTGVAWGASVIRFQAPTAGDISTGNIKSDAKRAIAAFIKRSWVLAGGSDVYGDATGTTDIPWEGYYNAEVNDASAAAGIAAVQIGARDDAGDTVRLRIRLGTTPATGYYLPFEDILLDDLVTVHTGTGQWDYNEQAFPVAAMTVALRIGGDWDCWVELGSSYSATPGRNFQVTPVPSHNHGPNPSLCDPTTPGTAATYIANWPWSDGPLTGGYANYQQLVTGAVNATGTPVGDFQMSNGQNNTEPNYKSAAAGAQLPSVGALKHFLVCTAGVGIPFSCDISQRGSTSGTRELKILWFNAAGGAISETVVHSDTGFGWVAIDTTITPPALATKWQINIIGRIDNVLAVSSAGVAGENPYAGNSNRAARCDHSHDPADHEHDYSDPDHVHGAEDVAYDNTASGLTADDVQEAIDELAAGGTGGTDLSMGTPASVTTTGTPAFLHFPGIAKLDADHLLLVYRQGTDHATTTDGKIVCKVGTIGADFAVTWGAQADVYDDGSLDCRDPEVAVLSDGTPIVSFFTWNGATAYTVRTVTGSWDGSTLTWDTPVTATTSFSGTKACSAKVVELFTGRLLLPIYGHNGSTPYTAAVIRSDDSGATWGNQVTIATGTIGDGNNWTEPYIVRLADGRLHCLIREDTDGRIYRTTSSDGGATWATPTNVYGGDARPAHIQVQSGGLLVVSRADPNGDTVYRESSDYGLTWTDETAVDATGTRSEYASIVQFNPYRYGVAYAIENTSTDADVKFVWFTDAANLDIIRGIGEGTSTSSTGVTTADVRDAGYWSPLTNGSTSAPELVFADGDTIAVWTET